jgi:maltodextrin utilization protein YvdJ
MTQLVTLYIIIAALMFAPVFLHRIALADFPVWRMVTQVMEPVNFLENLASSHH